MDTHKNAPLTPKGREAMVRSATEGGLTKAAAALQFNVSAKTVAKWVKRFREEGVDGLRDRSSRPLSSPSQTRAATYSAIEALRRQRHIGKQIATEVAISPATVRRILRRLGLNRLRDLAPDCVWGDATNECTVPGSNQAKPSGTSSGKHTA
ncbi:leucine zipper domain-containing protein [Bradyrhizobium sp. SUTN9-2]|uniref:helix-turn-helix domain-containing protein n=1 Tax=Bradyrhizobium sp. SUTN9-2 TaxID=1167456 RepID=UPI001FCE9EBD|nr:leucine zipper domain-containing protein [Bradyrhizobium sp. SUTN9-2]